MAIMRKRYQMLFLVFVTLGLYYPAVLGDWCLLDDIEHLNTILNYSWADLDKVLGIGADNAYRRPLANLLFYLTYVLFGDSEVAFHLFNVCVHALNGILVYLLIKTANPDARNQWVPLVGALIFVVHPLNVEAVAWVSGHCVVVSSFFALAALLMYLQASPRGASSRLWVSGGLYLCSLLSYEIAVALPLVLVGWELYQVHHAGDSSRRISFRGWRWAPYAVAAILYGAFRFLEPLVFGGKGTALKIQLSNPLSFLTKALVNPIAALGFYLRKLIFPWPLNFHLDQIATGPYFLVGLGFLTMSFWGWRQRRWGALWAWSWVCGLAAVLPLTFLPLSWTPVAERYSYLAVAFSALFLGVRLEWLWTTPLRLEKRWIAAALLLIMTVFAISSVQRAMVWQDNETLLTDTLAKSPDNAWVLFCYGSLLHNQGKAEEAKNYYKEAVRRGFVKHAAMRLGALAEAEGELHQAEAYYLQAAWPTQGVTTFTQNRDAEIYSALGHLHWLWASKEPERAAYHFERAAHFYQQAYEFSGDDPMILYNLGKVYLQAGKLEKAKACFRQVWEKVPETYYGEAAAKLMHVENLAREQGVVAAATNERSHGSN